MKMVVSESGRRGKFRGGRGEPVPHLTWSKDDAVREIDGGGRRMAVASESQ
jgi:hypothetical protein